MAQFSAVLADNHRTCGTLSLCSCRRPAKQHSQPHDLTPVFSVDWPINKELPTMPEQEKCSLPDDVYRVEPSEDSREDRHRDWELLRRKRRGS